MKKNIFLMLILILLSCASNNNKKIVKIDPLNTQLKKLNYKINLPKDWIAFLDLHNEISYKKKAYKGKYPAAQILVRRISKEKHKNNSLKEFVNKRNKNTKYLQNYSKTVSKTNSKFGETYTVVESYILNGKNTYTIINYFLYNNRLYYCALLANKEAFFKHISDYETILNELEFIRK